MTYIKASEEVIDAATEFVQKHLDYFNRFCLGKGDEASDLSFARLCEAVLSGPSKAGSADGAVSRDGMAGARRAVLLPSASPSVSQAAEVAVVQRDSVNHPLHYNSGGIEVIDAIEAWGLGFCDGNAVKYVARAGKKDPAKTVEDLKKARWYLDRLIIAGAK